MQRTESELRERYWLRVEGVQSRWAEVTKRWLYDGHNGYRRWMNIDHGRVFAGTCESSDAYIAACKALGHWPRRES